MRNLRFALALVLVAGLSVSARAEDDADDERYETGREDEPGTIDPFEHTAYMQLGFFRDSQSDVLGDVKLTALPMRFGFALPADDHLQVEGQFGVAGLVVDTSSALGDDHDRVFFPGNLALGAYYALGGDENGFLWTAGAGGQLVLPTSQNPDADQATSLAYASAVYGFVDSWLYRPESMGVVPGVYGRFAYRFLFANVDADLGIGISTDPDLDPVHAFQVRVEGGLRFEENYRLGVGYTNVHFFGDAAPTGGDAGQGALHLFVRGDLKALTVGCDFVMNLDAPLGFAFDDGGVWGIVTQVGLSL